MLEIIASLILIVIGLCFVDFKVAFVDPPPKKRYQASPSHEVFASTYLLQPFPSSWPPNQLRKGIHAAVILPPSRRILRAAPSGSGFFFCLRTKSWHRVGVLFGQWLISRAGVLFSRTFASRVLCGCWSLFTDVHGHRESSLRWNWHPNDALPLPKHQ